MSVTAWPDQAMFLKFLACCSLPPPPPKYSAGYASGVPRNLKRGKGHDFLIFFNRIFFRLNDFQADWKTRKVVRGSGNMLPWKNFENLHAVMAILALFE